MSNCLQNDDLQLYIVTGDIQTILTYYSGNCLLHGLCPTRRMNDDSLDGM